MLFGLGEGSFKRVLTEFTEHYHSEHPHQGQGDVLLHELDPIRWTVFRGFLIGRHGLVLMPTFRSIEHLCTL